MREEEEIMLALERINKQILLAFQDPNVSRQNIDKAITMFKQLLDEVIELTHPLTINREVNKELIKKGLME